LESELTGGLEGGGWVIAVSLDQIIELDLPAAPESYEELEKMRRDPRYKRYVERLEKLAERDQRYRKLLDKYRTPEGCRR
jgi:hypothetical protein